MNPLRLAWANLTVGDDNGYAIVAQALASSLQKAGAVILDEDAAETMPFERVVVVGLPTAWPFAPLERGPNFLWHTFLPMKPWPFPENASRPDLIWHTMLEVVGLPPGWTNVLNRCGLVWVPSKWVEQMFRNDGVTAPILVSGYGIDPAVFYPRAERKPGNPMRWGVWADDWGTRKHAEHGVAAWLAAGLEDATLDVRLTNATKPAPDNIAGRRDVNLLQGKWDRAKVGAWLRSLDGLVFLSGGEGFGLMALEAMACGVPVVCGFNSGMMDFLTEETALLVRKHKVAPAYDYTGRWAPAEEYLPTKLIPDFDEAVLNIRWAGAHRDVELQMLAENAARMAGAMTWEAAGRRAYTELKKRVTP